MHKTLSKSIISIETAADIQAAITTSLRDQGIRVGPTAKEVISAAGSAEERLANAGVALTNRVGCEYEHQGAGPWAKAYDYRKTVTRFRLRRATKGWMLVSAGNTQVYPQTSEIDRVILTAKAKEAVVKHALSSFSVLPEKIAA